jgi:hypothetical protein
MDTQFFCSNLHTRSHVTTRFLDVTAEMMASEQER